MKQPNIAVIMAALRDLESIDITYRRLYTEI